jgi:hypothetical protein
MKEAEHLVERAILQHQLHYVFDLIQLIWHVKTSYRIETIIRVQLPPLPRRPSEFAQDYDARLTGAGQHGLTPDRMIRRAG